MNSQHNALLRRARKEFDEHGRVRADTAAKLMAVGYIVPQLEDYWVRIGAWTV